MVKTIMIIMLLLHDGKVDFITKVVSTCPSKAIIEMKYDKLKTQGAIHDWSALCFDVNFEEKPERLKV